MNISEINKFERELEVMKKHRELIFKLAETDKAHNIRKYNYEINKYRGLETILGVCAIVCAIIIVFAILMSLI